MSCRSAPISSGIATSPTRVRACCTAIASTVRIPGEAHASTRTSCLDPYARMIVGPLRWSDAHFGYRVGARREDLSFDPATMRPACQNRGGSASPGVMTAARTSRGRTRSSTRCTPRVIRSSIPMCRSSCGALIRPRYRPGDRASPTPWHHRDRPPADTPSSTTSGSSSSACATTGAITASASSRPRCATPRPARWANSNDGEERPHSASKSSWTSSTTTPARATSSGPTLSFRGIDNHTYYRLQADEPRDRRLHRNGNTLNTAHPVVLHLIMDSLRYWVTEMHVDGFRPGRDAGARGARRRPLAAPSSASSSRIR